MTVQWQGVKPVLAAMDARLRAVMLRIGCRGHVARRAFDRVAIVCALGRHNGIAAGAVLQQAMLARLGVQADLVDAGAALHNPFFRARHVPASAYILHCGAPQTARLLSAVMPAAARAWRVGYWAWELPDPPADWHGHDALLHEIWTPSRFSRESLGRLTALPIEVVPHVVPGALERRQRRMGPFTVLCLADSRSSHARKNPMGAIVAFRRSFGASREARLIVKLNGAPAAHRDIEALAAGCGNVTLVYDWLDAQGLVGLFRSADALLSLHRSEGFGLPMLEAMAQGVPVVATGWSGNLDFMDQDCATLVPAELVAVQDASGIYRNSVWAEPDLDAAAQALRRLADDPRHSEGRSMAAHAAASAWARRLPSDVVWAGTRRGRLRAAVVARIACGVAAAPGAEGLVGGEGA